MTKGEAVANVLPDDVATWEADGWKADKPKAKVKNERRADSE